MGNIKAITNAEQLNPGNPVLEKKGYARFQQDGKRDKYAIAYLNELITLKVGERENRRKNQMSASEDAAI